MGSTLKITDGEVARRLSDSLHSSLERAIREALISHAEQIVCDAAKQLAANLRANVIAHENIEADQIVITLKIDGLEIALGAIAALASKAS